MWKRFLAGGLSGGIGAAIANPTDLLKARMQADTTIVAAKRMAQHAAEIYAAGGLGGFWLGVGTTVSRAVVLGAANLGTYSTAKALISEQGVKEGIPLHFCAATIAGLAIALSTAPIDLVRSRLMVQTTALTPPPQQQQQGSNSPRHYRNGLEVIRDVVRREGPMALYKGFWLQWARCAPYTVLQFVVWEQLCRVAGVRAV
jgi:solute carrier family 25 protein 14/30